MAERFSLNIAEVVNLLGLEVEPKKRSGDSFNVRCPFCGDKGYHMNINTAKDAYHCILCSGDDKQTGTLDLYARIRLNERCVKGDNSKRIFMQLKDELNGRVPNNGRRYEPAPKPEEPVYISCAPDEQIDKVFSEFHNLSLFALNKVHWADLKARGFIPNNADTMSPDLKYNGYASLPEPRTFTYKYPSLTKGYDAAYVGKMLRNNKSLRSWPVDRIRAGIITAALLENAGLDLDRVPGFFKLPDGKSCFVYTPGMLIPTRNEQGLIVGAQIRKNQVKEGDLRYLTVSSKGYEGGPTEMISRIHFPLANCSLERKDVAVIMTEGPLKADVAVRYRTNVAMVALQGVNNIACLNRALEYLQSNGVNKIFLAFDMDRYLNVHVERAAKTIHKKAKDYGIAVVDVAWGAEDAEKVYAALSKIAVNNHIPLPNTDSTNVFKKIRSLRVALDQANVDYKSVKWPSRSKGIDDCMTQNNISQET